MANRNFDRPVALNYGLTVISGSFRPNGASAINSSFNRGIGWSVARSGVGTYTVTLQDNFPALLGGILTLQTVEELDRILQWGAIDVVTARTLVIRAIENGVAADIASDVNDRVMFSLLLRNSGVTS